MDGKEENEVVRAHCNQCGGSRNGFVRAEYIKTEENDLSLVSWTDTFRVLQCCGCDSIIVQHQHYFSEDGEFEVNPLTGEESWIPNIKTTYFPPARVRSLPRWFSELENADGLLAEVLTEVYTALEANSLILATAGARILLDRAMVRLLDEDAGGFAEKLRAMTVKGMIGKEDQELLDVMTDAGNAASHRGYRPSRENLETILDTIENLLHRKFVLQPASVAVKAATPGRSASTRLSST